MTENKQPRRAPGWRLLRVAPRALSIVDRYKDTDRLIGSFATAVPRDATQYTTLFEQHRAQSMALGAANQRRAEAVSKLYDRTQGWLVHVHDAPGVNSTEYMARATVPEDVIAAARRLVGTVPQLSEAALPPEEATAFVQDMNELIEATEAEVAAVTSAKVEERRLAESVSAAATDLSKTLQRFRKAVGRALGTKHPDYRSLQIRQRNNTSETEAVDETEATSETDVVVPLSIAPAPQASPRPVPSAAFGTA